MLGLWGNLGAFFLYEGGRGTRGRERHAGKKENKKEDAGDEGCIIGGSVVK